MSPDHKPFMNINLENDCVVGGIVKTELGFLHPNKHSTIKMHSHLFFFLLWRQEPTKVYRLGLNLQSFCFSLPSNGDYKFATPRLSEWLLMQSCFSWSLGPISQSFSLAVSPNVFRASLSPLVRPDYKICPVCTTRL